MSEDQSQKKWRHATGETPFEVGLSRDIEYIKKTVDSTDPLAFEVVESLMAGITKRHPVSDISKIFSRNIRPLEFLGRVFRIEPANSCISLFLRYPFVQSMVASVIALPLVITFTAPINLSLGIVALLGAILPAAILQLTGKNLEGFLTEKAVDVNLRKLAQGDVRARDATESAIQPALAPSSLTGMVKKRFRAGNALLTKFHIPRILHNNVVVSQLVYGI